MQLKCPCGKLLKVPDAAAGKRVKCPGCGKVLQVPAGPSAPAGVPAAGGKIIVECSCGKKLAAPANAAGKQIRCPACKAAISVPAGKKTPDTGGVSVDLSLFSDSEEKDDEEYGVATSSCSKCGVRLEPGAQFCVSCGTHISTGTRVDGVDMDVIQRKKADTKKARYAILIIVIVAVIAMAASVVVLLPGFIARLGKSGEPGGVSPSGQSQSPDGNSEAPAPAPSDAAPPNPDN